MACESPLTINSKVPKYIDGNWTFKIPIACGKCPLCRKDILNGWVIRLMNEDRQALSSFFITLTYDNNHVPMTTKGYMTTDNDALPLYWKRLRKRDTKYWRSKTDKPKPPLKFYAVSEYGTLSMRPHYHAIVFNVSKERHLFDAWHIDGKAIGNVHVGKVTGASIAYTLKYIDKAKKIPVHRNDDRNKERSWSSKNLGSSYLTNAMIKYHKDDLTRYYVKNGEFKVKMPKYYADQIYTDEEKKQISKIMHDFNQQKDKELEKYVYKVYKGRMTIEEYKQHLRIGRWSTYTKNFLTRTKI